MKHWNEVDNYPKGLSSAPVAHMSIFCFEMIFDCSEAEELSPYELYEIETS